MSKLAPFERASIAKRVNELNAKLRDPGLKMDRIDELHKQRARLSKRLLDDSRLALNLTRAVVQPGPATIDGPAQ